MRLSPEVRREQILAWGVRIAKQHGLASVDATSISQRMDSCSAATVRRYYHTRAALWLAIVNHPEATKDLRRQYVALGFRL